MNERDLRITGKSKHVRSASQSNRFVCVAKHPDSSHQYSDKLNYISCRVET